MSPPSDQAVASIRPAAPQDEPRIRLLLEQAGLPHRDLGDHIESFLLAENGSALAGCIGHESYGPLGLLRSLAVAPDCRGRGLGRRLVRTLEKKAADSGVKELFLLTMSAEGFFARHGYHLVARERAPEEIKRSRQFLDLCPSSAICMRKALDS